MRMHILSGGQLRMRKHIFVPDADRDENIELGKLARAKVLVEPSGAAGLAALLFGKLGETRVTAGTVLTGGNADFDVLARIPKKEV